MEAQKLSKLFWVTYLIGGYARIQTRSLDVNLKTIILLIYQAFPFYFQKKKSMRIERYLVYIMLAHYSQPTSKIQIAFRSEGI